ncbi:MAG: hypothetical protein AB2L22_11740 [Syntrophales bacterium]
MGWQIPVTDNEVIDWETYEQRANDEHDGNINVVRYIKKWFAPDDLVWTRDTEGQYYLAKVLAPWEYLDNSEARDADIANVFRVDLRKIENVDDVPGKIIACLRASRTIQEIAEENAVTYTKMLWNEINNEERYPIDKKIDSLWSMLTDEQVEDLIFLYLQSEGWYVVPNSRKKDTMSYEFYAINKTSYQRAVVQAKTGNAPINLDEYREKDDLIYLFQTNGIYLGNERENHVLMKNEDLEKFIINNDKVIPLHIMKWFKKTQKNKIFQ